MDFEIPIPPIKKYEDAKLIFEINLEKNLLTSQSSRPSDEKIQNSIKNLFKDDFEQQKSSIYFFEYYLRDYDIVLPNEYLEATLEIFKSHLDDEAFVSNILAFYRHCTGFPSRMQDFLAKTEIFDLAILFFPSEDSLAILGNLSIANAYAREFLLSNEAFDQIIPLISISQCETEDASSPDQGPIILKNFENAVVFLNCLVYKLDDFDFSPWIPQFIEIFDILHSMYENISEKQAIHVIQAFSNYIDAHHEFIQSFIEKDQIKKFLEKDFYNNEIYLSITDIMFTIIGKYKTEGAFYLYNNRVNDWVGEQLFNESQKIESYCFMVLTKIIMYIDPPQDFVDECIQNLFLEKAIDYFKNKITYRLMLSIYRFVCTVCSNASTYQIKTLIDAGAIDLIINNTYIIEDEKESWHLVWKSLQHFLIFESNSEDEDEDKNDDNEEEDNIPELRIIHKKIQDIKKNEEFIQWLTDCLDIQQSFEFDDTPFSPDSDDMSYSSDFDDLNAIIEFFAQKQSL